MWLQLAPFLHCHSTRNIKENKEKQNKDKKGHITINVKGERTKRERAATLLGTPAAVAGDKLPGISERTTGRRILAGTGARSARPSSRACTNSCPWRGRIWPRSDTGSYCGSSGPICSPGTLRRTRNKNNNHALRVFIISLVNNRSKRTAVTYLHSNKTVIQHSCKLVKFTIIHSFIDRTMLTFRIKISTASRAARNQNLSAQFLWFMWWRNHLNVLTMSGL